MLLSTKVYLTFSFIISWDMKFLLLLSLGYHWLSGYGPINIISHVLAYRKYIQCMLTLGLTMCIMDCFNNTYIHIPNAVEILIFLDIVFDWRSCSRGLWYFLHLSLINSSFWIAQYETTCIVWETHHQSIPHILCHYLMRFEVPSFVVIGVIINLSDDRQISHVLACWK